MTAPSRYDVSDNTAELDSGVLKNKLKIKDQKTLNDLETFLLSDTYSHFLSLVGKNQVKFPVDFIFKINHYFLNTLYDWAGSVRQVNISKGGSLFVPVNFLPNALKELDEVISKNLPSSSDNKDAVVKKLAIIVCEFNVIHPFREGNGRTIRLFVDLLLVQNGYKMVDYSLVKELEYIDACIAGMKKEYKQMEKILKRCIKKQ